MNFTTVKEKKLQKELQKIEQEEAVKGILELYEAYKVNGSEKCLSEKEIQEKIDLILRSLFEVPYMNEVMIPQSFLSSEVAKLIFTMKYCIIEITAIEREYTTTELAELLECSNQYLNKLIKTNKVEAVRKGKMYFFSQLEVERLLNKKGKSLSDYPKGE